MKGFKSPNHNMHQLIHLPQALPNVEHGPHGMEDIPQIPPCLSAGLTVMSLQMLSGKYSARSSAVKGLDSVGHT